MSSFADEREWLHSRLVQQLSGRKRHLLVDTLGLLLKVVVHSAKLQDREGVPLLLEPVKGQFPRMEKVWVDNAYTGTGRTWIKEHMGWEVEVVSHPRRPRGMWVWPASFLPSRSANLCHRLTMQIWTPGATITDKWWYGLTGSMLLKRGAGASNRDWRALRK